MSTDRIRIGTRGSQLALAQARLVAAAYEREGRPTRLVVVETEGDRRAPDTAWGEGAFVAAIERALLDDRVDVAVHSAKDVPTDEDERLRIAAYLPREDPADVLVVREGRRVSSLGALPHGARVGTDSPRRQGFLLAARPDLRVHPLHGNVDTRLRRLDEGETDALVLAAAGLVRLGRGDRISLRLDPALVPPAPGQGAIAVQVRRADARMIALTVAIDDPATRASVEAERRFLAGSGGGCRAPIGALARVERGTVDVIAGRVEPDGTGARFETASGGLSDANALIDELLERFATGVARRQTRRALVLLTRPEAQARRLVRALAERDIDAAVAPTVAIGPPRDPAALEQAIAGLAGFRWAVVTSANGAAAAVRALRELGIDAHAAAWAAVGPATAEVLGDIGIEPWLPGQATARALAEELAIEPGERVLLLRGNLADAGLPSSLAARGAVVEEVEAYRTVEAPPESATAVEAALVDPALAGVVLASPSAARGLLALAASRADTARGLPAVCIGSTTATAARELGFSRVTVAARPAADAVADAVASTVRPTVGVHA